MPELSAFNVFAAVWLVLWLFFCVRIITGLQHRTNGKALGFWLLAGWLMLAGLFVGPPVFVGLFTYAFVSGLRGKRPVAK